MLEVMWPWTETTEPKWLLWKEISILEAEFVGFLEKNDLAEAKKIILKVKDPHDRILTVTNATRLLFYDMKSTVYLMYCRYFEAKGAHAKMILNGVRGLDFYSQIGFFNPWMWVQNLDSILGACWETGRLKQSHYLIRAAQMIVEEAREDAEERARRMSKEAFDKLVADRTAIAFASEKEKRRYQKEASKRFQESEKEIAREKAEADKILAKMAARVKYFLAVQRCELLEREIDGYIWQIKDSKKPSIEELMTVWNYPRDSDRKDLAISHELIQFQYLEVPEGDGKLDRVPETPVETFDLFKQLSADIQELLAEESLDDHHVPCLLKRVATFDGILRNRKGFASFFV